MAKSDSDRAYDEAYLAGKSADGFERFSHNLADFRFSWEGPPSSIERAREAGYRDGASDKYDSDNSHYQSGRR